MQMENKRTACLAAVYLFSSFRISNVKRDDAEALFFPHCFYLINLQNSRRVIKIISER